MQLGIRAHDYGRFLPGELMARIAADGFSAMQLACKKAITGIACATDITPVLIEEVRALLRKNSLSVAVYGSYVELSMVDEAFRRQQADEFRSQLRNACALSSGCIGSETTSMTKQPHVSRTQAIAALRKSLEEILPDAQAMGVTVGIEPVADHALHTPEATAQLLREMASPNLKVIFDPVNLMTAELFPRQIELWERSFDCFGDMIAAVHIKGICLNEQGVCQKCSLTESQIDWNFLLAQLQKSRVELPLLWEEAMPTSEVDLQYLKSLLD